MTSKVLSSEVLKLLIQVAWADRDVADEERNHILELAVSAGLSGDELDNFRASLAHSEDLPAPNLAYLRDHRVEVREAAQVLIRLDQRIAPEETTLLAHIDRLLS